MIDNIIRSAIKNKMEAKKMTSRDVSKLTGIAQSMIYYYIQDQKDISTGKALNICKALNIKIKCTI